MSVYQVQAWRRSDFFGDVVSPSFSQSAEIVTLSKNAEPLSLQISDGDTSEIGSAVLSKDVSLAGVVYPVGSRIVLGAALDSENTPSIRFVIAHIVHCDFASRIPDGTLVFATYALTPGVSYGLRQTVTTGQDCAASFARSTGIDTPHGELPIESLEIGDEVLTRDGSVKVIQDIARHRYSAIELVLNRDLRPVIIQADAISTGLPGHTLTVSQQHRLLLNDWRAPYLFGEDEILVPAKSLLNDRTVFVDCPRNGVEYFQIILEQHDLISANGLWAETGLPQVDAVALTNDADDSVAQIDNFTANSDSYRTILPALPSGSAASLVA